LVRLGSDSCCWSSPPSVNTTVPCSMQNGENLAHSNTPVSCTFPRVSTFRMMTASFPSAGRTARQLSPPPTDFQLITWTVALGGLTPIYHDWPTQLGTTQNGLALALWVCQFGFASESSTYELLRCGTYGSKLPAVVLKAHPEVVDRQCRIYSPTCAAETLHPQCRAFPSDPTENHFLHLIRQSDSEHRIYKAIPARIRPYSPTV
jgi:hypothetical protein